MGKYTGAGITAHLMASKIRNFKTDEIKNCAYMHYMHYMHEDDGFIDIGITYLDEQQFDTVKEIIVDKQN